MRLLCTGILILAMWNFSGKRRPTFAIEPGPGQESVWDYPRPPSIALDQRVVEVRDGDRVLASSHQSMKVRETASPPTFYLPIEDVDMDALQRVSYRTFCEWKGHAGYWGLKTRPGSAPVAWAYPDPLPAFESLRGHLCFYPGRVECRIDGQPVRSQSGAFYGGWITPEVVGPFKGDPGTGHW
jgi:uncharacterized protein (DUF427 family)